VEPDVSPDGAWIVFASYRDGRMDPFRGEPAAELYRARSDGTEVERLTNDYWPDMQPAWAPDGLRVAFAQGRGVDAAGRLDTDIWVVFAGGSGPRNLTPGSLVAEGDPDWSPDGLQLVYCATGGLDQAGQLQSDLVRMDADGQERRQLTRELSRDVEPAWSPDGTKIAFASDRDGHQYDIFLMNLDGTGVVNVTAAPGSNERAPAWGPGGKTLAFVSDRGGLAEIYVMDQVGGPARRLLPGYGPASAPAWWPAALGAGKLGQTGR